MAKKSGFVPGKQKPVGHHGQPLQSGHPGHVTGRTMAAKVAGNPTAIVAKDASDRPIPTPTRW